VEPASDADFAIHKGDKTEDEDQELRPFAKLVQVKARLAEEANGIRYPYVGLDAVASVAKGFLLSLVPSLGTFCSDGGKTHKAAEERF